MKRLNMLIVLSLLFGMVSCQSADEPTGTTAADIADNTTAEPVATDV